MLASDLANPEFVNPRNPDELLHVEFYWKEPVSKWQSELKGKEVRLPKIPYVRMMKPGDNTSIIETAVRDDHKARWPQKWLAWQMKEGLIEGSAVDVPGWKLEEWEKLKGHDEQIHELKYLRFHTVEQLAGASDAQLQRLGLGGIGLREQARVALKERNRAEYKAEMEAKDKELVEMKERLAKLEALLPISGKEMLHVPKKG